MDEEKLIENNKILCQEMPYIMIRDAWTGKLPKLDTYDYRYTWLNCNELPEGWLEHFKNLCFELKEPLKQAKLLKKFYFVQVKEKYDTMRCYTNITTKEIDDIINKYENEATKICVNCGKPATCYTKGYIASYCDECSQKFKEKTYPIDKFDF